jgi:hypothetical protein
VPYILFKLEEIKKERPLLFPNMLLSCLGAGGSSPFSLFNSKILVSYQNFKKGIIENVNIGEAPEVFLLLKCTGII